MCANFLLVDSKWVEFLHGAKLLTFVSSVFIGSRNIIIYTNQLYSTQITPLKKCFHQVLANMVSLASPRAVRVEKNVSAL